MTTERPKPTEEQLAAIIALMQPELEQCYQLIKEIDNKIDASGDEWTYSRGVGRVLITIAQAFHKVDSIVVGWGEREKQAGLTSHGQSGVFYKIETPLVAFQA